MLAHTNPIERIGDDHSREAMKKKSDLEQLEHECEYLVEPDNLDQVTKPFRDQHGYMHTHPLYTPWQSIKKSRDPKDEPPPEIGDRPATYKP